MTNFHKRIVALNDNIQQHMHSLFEILRTLVSSQEYQPGDVQSYPVDSSLACSLFSIEKSIREDLQQLRSLLDLNLLSSKEKADYLQIAEVVESTLTTLNLQENLVCEVVEREI